MRGTRTTSAIAATFVTVAITTTATAASTTDDPTKDQGGVLVATFGDAEAPTPPRSMSLDELEATYPEVPADEINEYLSGDPSALRSQASVSQDESGLPIEVLSRLVDQRVTRRADCLLSRRCAPSLPRRHEGPWVADSWSTSSSSRSIGTPLWKGPGSYQGDEVGGLTLCQRALGGLDELRPTGNWCG